MNPAQKIQAGHLKRQAVIYVRQSTPTQVVHHRESTRRQYQLTDRAHELGWPKPLITVIDEDLGLSGATSASRTGFQRLVTALSLGEVGIVLVTEVSRLSRLNSDWHRVIELAAIFQTLIADEDGIYDPGDPNDRLVLGLKGTLFAAELHVLRARMRGGLLNKARRGELALRLPVGYRRLDNGSVVLEPDQQVRHTLGILFDTFQKLGNARAVQRYFYRHQLDMPRLHQDGPQRGQIVWVKPSYQMIQQVLTNPVYAGVFAYGRRKVEVIPGDPPDVRIRRQAMDEWVITLPDIYPAYISYSQYLENRQTLRANLYNFANKHAGAAREGSALLQGLVVCTRCGRRLTLQYGPYGHTYVCRRAKLTYDEPQCQAFAGRYLDPAVGTVFLEAVQPARLEATLAALDLLEAERQALDRAWQQRLERARYETGLAQRRYEAVDPAHRLVAAELEKGWDDALVILRELEHQYEQVQHDELAPLSQSECDAIRQLAEDLPALWSAPTTTDKDRKRLLRLVICQVSLMVNSRTRSAEFVIQWCTGATTQHSVTCPPIGWHCTTDATVVERIRDLARSHPDHRIAEQLNAEGIRTQTGKSWTYERVVSMRKQHRIPTACPIKSTASGARDDGLIETETAAEQLSVSTSLVRLWARQGVLASDQRILGSKLWVRLTDDDRRRLTGLTNTQQLPTIRELMIERQVSYDQIWEMVRAGSYVAHRARHGKNWEWRLQATSATTALTGDADAVDVGPACDGHQDPNPLAETIPVSANQLDHAQTGTNRRRPSSNGQPAIITPITTAHRST